MNWKSAPIALLVFVAFSLADCRMLTAPVRYVFHSPEPTPAPNTVVTKPGRPLPAPSLTPRVASRKSTSKSPGATPKPVASKTTSSAQFPTAKPVPGKPGLVFNPFKAYGSYIDVSGYAPGSKVKDPDSQKIFVVP